jgi:hypothetical protein
LLLIRVWSGGKKVATKTKRWYKDVGLGFKTPAEAINGTYIGEFEGGRREEGMERADEKDGLEYVFAATLCRQKVPVHW